MVTNKDAIGQAILHFAQHKTAPSITVKADLCEDDILPVEYLFRDESIMPELEQVALTHCKGNVLDVGAAAGCHASILQNKGLNVQAIDLSPGAVEYLKSQGIKAEVADFYSYKGQFDTLLLLMNGIGIAGTLDKLPAFLSQVKALLTPNGSAICESTDLSYLYQEDDGSMWVDLNGSYHGEMQFRMQFESALSDWFGWLYIDFELLCEFAQKAGLKCTKLYDGPSHNYLVSLTHL